MAYRSSNIYVYSFTHDSNGIPGQSEHSSSFSRLVSFKGSSSSAGRGWREGSVSPLLDTYLHSLWCGGWTGAMRWSTEYGVQLVWMRMWGWRVGLEIMCSVYSFTILAMLSVTRRAFTL